MVLPALVVACVSGGALVVAVIRVRNVASLLPVGARELRTALLGGNRVATAAAVRGLFTDETDRAVLDRALFEGSSREAAVATLNERLGEVSRALAVGRTVPRSMGRVALAAGTLGAVLEIGGSLSSPDGAAWVPALWEFFAGCLGAGVALELDRRSVALAERVRGGWDEVAASCEKHLGSSDERLRPG